MQFGIGIRFGKVDRVFRTAEMAVIAAIEQFALGVREIEKGRLVRFNVVQRHNIEIDVCNIPVFDGHSVPEYPLRTYPVVFGSFAHDHQKVVGHGVAVGRAAGQIPEQQDIFGIEIAVSQALDDPGGFGGIVKAFGGLSRFGSYALCGVFLHGVLIRFHSIDC